MKNGEIELKKFEDSEVVEDMNPIIENPVVEDTTSLGASEISRETQDNSHILRIKPSEKINEVVVENSSKFSDLEDDKVNFVDLYQDTRTFLAKANSTKFMLVCYLMVTIPLLLMYGYVSEDVYKDMVILISIGYLGIDVYEKKSMIKK